MILVGYCNVRSIMWSCCHAVSRGPEAGGRHYSPLTTVVFCQPARDLAQSSVISNQRTGVINTCLCITCNLPVNYPNQDLEKVGIARNGVLMFSERMVLVEYEDVATDSAEDIYYDAGEFRLEGYLGRDSPTALFSAILQLLHSFSSH